MFYIEKSEQMYFDQEIWVQAVIFMVYIIYIILIVS